MWEFGSTAQAAMNGIHALGHALGDVVELANPDRGARLRLRALFELAHQGAAIVVDAGRLIAEQPRDLSEHIDKAWPAVARGLGKVSSAPDRFGIGGEKHGQGPAAGFAQEVQCGHIDLVDVGALFAIDFDVDVERVHDRGDVVVLEAFVGHDVAPMAGGVADR